MDLVPMPEKQKNRPAVTMPGLNNEMISRGATNVSLSIAAGVSESTIHTARRGGRVALFTAECIRDALISRQYQRDNRGARRSPDGADHGRL